MLIGYSMPAIASLALTSTQAGAAFLGTTSDGLTDTLPARVARLQWMTAAGQVLADNLRLSLRLSGANQAYRAVCVLGLTLPVGTQIRAELYDGHTGSTLVGGITTRAVQISDGSTGAWFVWPSTVAASNRLEIVIYNDVLGVAAIAAGAVFEIGEIAVMPALEIQVESDWSDDLVDPSESALTRDSQPATVGRLAYRKIEATLSADGAAAARGGGLAGGMDWSKLRRAFEADGRVMAIMRWRNDALAIDLAWVAQTALYGTARMSPIQHLGGDVYSAAVTFVEAPAN